MSAFSERGGSSPPQKECDRCGTRISGRSSLKDHYKATTCKTQHLVNQLTAEGLVRCNADFAVSVLQGAGIPTRMEATGEARRTRRGQGSPEMKRWAPAWVAEVLTEEWKLIGEFTHDEAKPFYIAMVKRMAADPEYRESVDAVIRMSGKDGLRRYVIDGKARAVKLRAQAQDAFERYSRLKEEADSLDPPLAEAPFELVDA